ncbi:LOW QUALITY PROTEIN: colorectal mutant cancer protein [Etheostoma spectabile]|uniref:LOW QUALITY PROTEIN: colorectal mutant cancer protein n=1 Tax=Etheostoma spectabile TaxID=54343 RepID=UPI0013AF27B2|nr:LOW QUALITY PROTEIN: colorectal mutant cancer protein [Etheostoma spectabile]
MEDSCLVRCDSLDAGSGRDRELMTSIHHMTLDPEGSEPTANLEPSPAELAQCEADVGTLLSIIAELNKKMGSLKAPSEAGDLRPPGPSRPLVPDLLSHRAARSSQERKTASAAMSKPQLTDRGGDGVVWTKLQEVLTSVEDSVSCKRSWAAPITASDQDKHREHLRAAQESWVKATQILEEMEIEFGISCPPGLPKNQYPEAKLDLEKRDSALRSTFQSHQEELERAQSTVSQMEEEKNKLVGLHKAWRSGNCSPSYRPTAGALTPDRASPPFPRSPLLYRRAARAVTPLSVGEDSSPVASGNSCSPCRSPISLESETERLNRCIERLRARNERLTAALERTKGESEQISITLHRLEANCSALQMALSYCEECEEAYSELLSLYDAKKQHSIPLQTDSAEAVGDSQQPDSQSAQLIKMGTEELSTSFSTAGVTEGTETQSHTGHRSGHSLSVTHRTPELVGREAVLRQQIERLKRERAAICLPKPSPGVEGKMSPETGHLDGSRGGHVTKDNAKPPDTKKEKASLFYELISVREEMSDLRALIRLKEKELRCLEWGFMAQKAQESAGAFAPESLREEMEDRKTEQQKLCETVAELGSDGDIADPRTRPILKELQAVLQREQALKKRLAFVQDSLNTALSDSTPHRRDNEEQIARLTQAHSKALSSYRQIRRKYREQVWRLEQKVAAMTGSHHHQSGAQKAAGEALEWRREETVL